MVCIQLWLYLLVVNATSIQNQNYFAFHLAWWYGYWNAAQAYWWTGVGALAALGCWSSLVSWVTYSWAHVLFSCGFRYLFGEEVDGIAHVVFGVIQNGQKKSFTSSLQRVQVRTCIALTGQFY